MSTPFDPPHPLLRSLTDDAADLPARAAAEARQVGIRRSRLRLRAALAALTMVFGWSAWSLLARHEARLALAAAPRLKPDPAPAEPREFVKVRTEDEAMHAPLPLPEGLDREQQELFKAARGLPLLLVRDDSGKVVRIHVIER